MDAKKIDFLQGIAINDVPSGAIVRGVVDSEDVILVRRGDDFFFIGAQCSHYHGELAEFSRRNSREAHSTDPGK